MNPGSQRKTVGIIIRKYNQRFFKTSDPHLPSNHHGGKAGSWKKRSIFTHMFNPWTDDSETAARIRWSGHVLAPHRRAEELMESVGWNWPPLGGTTSRFRNEKLGGYPRKQKAQAEFPNMRGDDFRPLRVATQGWGLPQSMAVARFFCVSSCKRCEFLVPLPSIQFLFLFLFVLLGQSMMIVMVTWSFLPDPWLWDPTSRSLRGQGKLWQEESCTVCRTQVVVQRLSSRQRGTIRRLIFRLYCVLLIHLLQVGAKTSRFFLQVWLFG